MFLAGACRGAVATCSWSATSGRNLRHAPLRFQRNTVWRRILLHIDLTAPGASEEITGWLDRNRLVADYLINNAGDILIPACCRYAAAQDRLFYTSACGCRHKYQPRFCSEIQGAGKRAHTEHVFDVMLDAHARNRHVFGNKGLYTGVQQSIAL